MGSGARRCSRRPVAFLDDLSGTRSSSRRSPTRRVRPHLADDFELVADTFRSFAENEIKPVAEHVHRHNDDVPENIIAGLAEMGAFGLSVPAEYGGFSEGGDGEYLAMVVATEELSRGSLGIGGSLITRPEILTRALVKGGTEAQKQYWLPKLATTEVMVAVAVTEPDYGSDVAGLTVSATPAEGPSGAAGLRDQRRQDLVHVRRPGRRADAARPDRSRPLQDPSRAVAVHRAQAPRRGPRLRLHAGGPARTAPSARWRAERSTRSATAACTATRSPSTTGGCRRRTSSARSPASARASTTRWKGFENGRLQTAARAVGVMQAAYEAALEYANNRKVFGSNIIEYELTKVKLGRMAALIQAGRQFSYAVATLMAKGQGQIEASMVKAYVCKAAEWVTREAMQIHGGMGYAEEYTVSRLFVDARVLSIFEGADETLCLKVIARRLADAPRLLTPATSHRGGGPRSQGSCAPSGVSGGGGRSDVAATGERFAIPAGVALGEDEPGRGTSVVVLLDAKRTR